jgi:hypothetical protein
MGLGRDVWWKNTLKKSRDTVLLSNLISWKLQDWLLHLQKKYGNVPVGGAAVPTAEYVGGPAHVACRAVPLAGRSVIPQLAKLFMLPEELFILLGMLFQ